MGAALTTVKVLLGIFTILLLLSIGYLVLSSQPVKQFAHEVLDLANKTNPQLAQFLAKVGSIVYEVCELGYLVTKPVVDTIYNLLTMATQALS